MVLSDFLLPHGGALKLEVSPFRLTSHPRPTFVSFLSFFLSFFLFSHLQIGFSDRVFLFYRRLISGHCNEIVL